VTTSNLDMVYSFLAVPDLGACQERSNRRHHPEILPCDGFDARRL